MSHIKTIIMALAVLAVGSFSVSPAVSAAETQQADYDNDSPIVKELTVVHKEEARELTISYGNNHTVMRGEKRNVKIRHSVRGRTMYRLVGQIRVEDFIVAGEARCKVTKGGKEIYKAYLETPDRLYIE